MKQLALAFHNHEDAKKEFPLSYMNPSEAKNNWAPHVLPYLEEQNLINGYDLKTDWWIEPNRTIAAQTLSILICPSTPDPYRVQDKPESTPPNKTGACGDYFAPAGVHLDINLSLTTGQLSADQDLRGVIHWYEPTNKRNRAADITDGLSKSIMLGECAGREDVYRGRVKFPVQYTGAVPVRAGAAPGPLPTIPTRLASAIRGSPPSAPYRARSPSITATSGDTASIAFTTEAPTLHSPTLPCNFCRKRSISSPWQS